MKFKDVGFCCQAGDNKTTGSSSLESGDKLLPQFWNWHRRHIRELIGKLIWFDGGLLTTEGIGAVAPDDGELIPHWCFLILMVDEKLILMVACGCEEKTVWLSVGFWIRIVKHSWSAGIFSLARLVSLSSFFGSTLRTKNSLLREASQVSISGLYLSAFFLGVWKIGGLFFVWKGYVDMWNRPTF